MALREEGLILSDAQAVTATAFSTDVLYVGTGKNTYGSVIQIDPGEYATNANYLNIVVNTTFTGTGTIAFTMTTCDTLGGTYVATDFSVAAIVGTSLTAGLIVARVKLPSSLLAYSKLTYTVSGTVGAGSLDAWIGLPCNG